MGPKVTNRVVGSGFSSLNFALCLIAVTCAVLPLHAQVVTVTIQGRVYDTTGAAISQATVNVVNADTGFARSTTATATGDYQISSLPVGEYTVSAEKTGFQKSAKKVHLDVGATGNLDFNLSPGQVLAEVTVQDVGEVAEPTRTMISSVIDEQKIENLPVNGREFIDFALLAPGVTIGDTTSGSTDVIVEPVTKLSFAGQNIHFNFIAVDGADDISTASGIQRGTPPQEAVQEFRVINTDYTTEFGRATAGIVNIITKSGTNNWHGSLYEYFRNNVMDAKSILSAPGFNILRQNQFGASLGGPVKKDKTFIFANYEGQRRGESPTYNSAVLGNITAINQVKTQVFGLPAENLFVLRAANTDNGFFRLDENLSSRNYLYVRYFINDDRLTNQSPLNNGFDLPSAFKNNNIRDQSLAGGLTTTFSPSWINDLRMQYAHRTFDFPVVSTQPHLEVANTFAVGVNRGNPTSTARDATNWWTMWRTMCPTTPSASAATSTACPPMNPFHSSTHSRPTFQTFKLFLAPTVRPDALPGAACPDPFVIFFERFSTTTNPPFTEPTLQGGTAVYHGGPYRSLFGNRLPRLWTTPTTASTFRTSGALRRRLTLNAGLRWEFETWPSHVLNTQSKNFDPRIGLAYDLGTSHNAVFRAGFGLFHGIIPSPLLMCQQPSCGGLAKYPGRSFEDGLNANTGLFSYASTPGINFLALNALLTQGTYPNGTSCTFIFPGCTLDKVGFLQDATIVRFNQDHQNPYGIQASAALEFQPFKDTVLSISGVHVRGVHLGSFYNVNQPDPSGSVLVHNSNGSTSCKNVYFDFASPLNPGGPITPPNCTAYPSQMVIPTVPHVAGVPGFRDPQFSVFFEATSKWDSVYDGLLVNLNKRLARNFSFAVSYTYSHSIDDGPNPSFVLIPQDSANFRAERASSADDARHRFVGNAIFSSPASWNLLLRDFTFSTIVTLQSPQYFTKYAGFDVNGDVFGNNDRVGGEPRNTFKGDSLQTVDMRLERAFSIREKLKLRLLFEAFNLMNTVNVHYFNTTYGAADFCPSDAGAPGCAGATKLFREGSPNPLYGTPSAVFNPRQLQLAARFTW